MSQTRWVIRVTPEDIARGKRNDSRDCPVGLAIARCIDWASDIRSYEDSIRLTDRGTRESYLFAMPGKPGHALQQYDAGVPFPPMTFSLRDPHIAPMRTFRRSTRKAKVKARVPDKDKKTRAVHGRPGKQRSYGHRFGHREVPS